MPRPGGSAQPGGPGRAVPSAGASSGRVVHDERGNAVWDWLKQTSRIAIESTSRLLRRLEVPELKVEDPQESELRLMPEKKQTGYDPYNQDDKPTRGRK